MESIYSLSVDCPATLTSSSAIIKPTHTAAPPGSRSSISTLVTRSTTDSQRFDNHSSTLIAASSNQSGLILTNPALRASSGGPAMSTSNKPQQASTSSESGINGPNSANDNLSRAATVAIGVVIPAVGVIVALVFGIRTWNKRVWIAGGGSEPKPSGRQSANIPTMTKVSSTLAEGKSSEILPREKQVQNTVGQQHK